MLCEGSPAHSRHGTSAAGSLEEGVPALLNLARAGLTTRSIHGSNMQQKCLGSAGHVLGAVLVLVSALVLFACGGTGERRNLNADVPLTSANITAVEGSFPPQFTFPDGSVFSPDICQQGPVPAGSICGSPVSFTFVPSSGTPPTLFVLSQFGSAAIASGGVSFGSCTLTVTTSAFAAGKGPQTGATITFSTCDLLVSANNVEVGGDPETGTITLMLTNTAVTPSVSAASTSQTLFSAVAIKSDGFLLLNGVNMGINTNITGTVPK